MYIELKSTIFVILTFFLCYKNIQFILEDLFNLYSWKLFYLISFIIMTYFFVDIVKESYPIFRVCYFISPFSILFSSFFSNSYFLRRF